jgi:hypothetical protein
MKNSDPNAFAIKALVVAPKNDSLKFKNKRVCCR